MILNIDVFIKLCSIIIEIYLKWYMAVYMVYMDLVLWPVDAIC